MKKISAVIVALILMFSLVACVTFMAKENENINPPKKPWIPSIPNEPNEPNDTSNNPDNPSLSDKPYDENSKADKIYLFVNGNILEVTLANNSSVDALVVILRRGNITYTASDYGGFEKVGYFGYSLPVNHTQINAKHGDIVLYGNNQIVIFYGENTWSYTRIGKINGYTTSQLSALLKGEKVQITLSLQSI